MSSGEDIMRAAKPGWTELVHVDDRRGMWMRITKGKIEFCAGREGDDILVSLPVGSTVEAGHTRGMHDILLSLEWARDRAVDDGNVSEEDAAKWPADHDREHCEFCAELEARYGHLRDPETPEKTT